MTPSRPPASRFDRELPLLEGVLDKLQIICPLSQRVLVTCRQQLADAQALLDELEGVVGLLRSRIRDEKARQQGPKLDDPHGGAR